MVLILQMPQVYPVVKRGCRIVEESVAIGEREFRAKAPLQPSSSGSAVRRRGHSKGNPGQCKNLSDPGPYTRWEDICAQCRTTPLSPWKVSIPKAATIMSNAI